jgi:hypothetical protein
MAQPDPAGWTRLPGELTLYTELDGSVAPDGESSTDGQH